MGRRVVWWRSKSSRESESECEQCGHIDKDVLCKKQRGYGRAKYVVKANVTDCLFWCFYGFCQGGELNLLVVPLLCHILLASIIPG